MKLIITEKPSAGQAYAKVLGVRERHDGYLEGGGYIVSWCIGHLVELSEPEEYNIRYSKWEYADLPIIPDDWKYRVSSGTQKQFEILKKLMARKDVTGVINCCDAGREGELIFRLVYHLRFTAPSGRSKTESRPLGAVKRSCPSPGKQNTENYCCSMWL